MRNRILVFDFDGTIADTFHHLLTISNRLSAEFNFKKINIEEIAFLQDKTPKEIVKYLNVPILKIPRIVARVKKELFKEIILVEPVNGLKEILCCLKSSSGKMGILSSNSSENVINFLKIHELDFFDFIQTTSKIWGKHTALKKIIKTNKFNERDMIYIGDEIRDIAAAKKAGIKIAAVTWGYNSEKTLEIYHPDFIIREPKELLRLCQI